MNSLSAWTCQYCGKGCFFSKREAKAAAAKIDRKCRAYQCPVDDTIWHYGHLPTAVLKGDFDRHKFRQMRGQNP